MQENPGSQHAVRHGESGLTRTGNPQQGEAARKFAESMRSTWAKTSEASTSLWAGVVGKTRSLANRVTHRESTQSTGAPSQAESRDGTSNSRAPGLASGLPQAVVPETPLNFFSQQAEAFRQSTQQRAEARPVSRPESISNDSRSHQHPPLPAHPGGATEGHEAMPEPHPQRGQEGSDEAPTAEARSVPGVAYDASKETAAVPAVSPPADPSDYYKGGIPTDIALTASQPPPPPQTPFERGSLSEGSSGADSPSETAQGASTAALSSSGADVLRAADEGARGEELGGGREEKAVNRTMTREGGAERASEGAQEGLAVERGQAEAEAEIERLRQQRDEMEDALLRALRERDELADNLQGLSAAADERDDLRLIVASLEADLGAARAGVGEAGDAAQIKLLERARDAALEEVASSQLVVGELKERMQVLEKEVSMAAKALEDEKKKASSARGAFLEELDGILHSSSSERSLWPRTVRRLVERVEEEAMARGETRAREAEEAVEKRLWAKLKEAEEQAREAEERGAAREREVADLKGRLERLERELGEREESLLRRVEEERSEVEKRLGDALEAAREEAKVAKEDMEEATREKRRMEERLAKLRDDLVAVRQRARAMVEQRDERIAKLEAALSGQAQKGAGTTPASLALPALRTDSGGLPTPPATPSDRDVGASIFDHASAGALRSMGEEHNLSKAVSLDAGAASPSHSRDQRTSGPVGTPSSMDVDYLRAVLVQGLATGQLKMSSPLFAVLQQVLRLSQEEMARIQRSHVKPGSVLELPGMNLILPTFAFGSGHSGATSPVSRRASWKDEAGGGGLS